MNVSIPWVLARLTIHICYEYNEDNVGVQWGFVCEVPTEALNNLLGYAYLKRYEEHIKCDDLIDWGDLIKLVSVELEYRTFYKLNS